MHPASHDADYVPESSSDEATTEGSDTESSDAQTESSDAWTVDDDGHLFLRDDDREQGAHALRLEPAFTTFVARAAGAGECAICLEAVAFRQRGATLLCGHAFHRGCALRWFERDTHKRCPCCRASSVATRAPPRTRPVTRSMTRRA